MTRPLAFLWLVPALVLSLAAGPAAAAARNTASGSDEPIGLGDDVPTREPTLAWQTPVSCPSGRCAIAVADRIAVVMSPGKPAEVTVIDVRDGSELWRRDIVAQLLSAHVVGRLLVLLGSEHAVILDAASGDPLVMVEAPVKAVSRAAILFADDGTTLSGIDATTGKTLWTRRHDVRLVDVCRGVVLLAGRSGDSGIEAIDQRTGASRWRSTHRFDAGHGSLLCGGPWLYVANGSSIAELELATGLRNWQTSVAGATRFEFLGDETGIAFGDDGITGINLWDGAVLWHSAVELGQGVDAASWLRRRGGLLFKLLPWSGATSAPVDPFAELDLAGVGEEADAPVEVIHTSASRVMVRRGTTIATLGLSDLGLSWALELPASPHWAGASDGVLLVVDDDSIDGYRPVPLVVTPT